MNSVKLCWDSASQIRESIQMSEPFLHTLRSISFVEGSLVRTSPAQENGPGSTVNAPASGPSTGESSKKRGRGSSLSKTSRASERPGSIESFKTWPRSGMMRSGIVSPLQASAPLTSVTGSSSSRGTVHECDFPTPTMARKDLWPTPVVTDAKSSGRANVTTGVMHPGTSLTDAVRASSAPEPSPGGAPGAKLKSGLVLNPDWVELLMGLPGDWTSGSEALLGPSARLSVARMRARSAKPV